MQIREGLILLGWLVGWWLLWRVPGLPRAAPARRARDLDVADRARSTTVIVPARNEAASIGALLGSLARQQPAPGEVVVVDDGSDDATADLARSFPGVEVIAGEPLPEARCAPWWHAHGLPAQPSGSRLVFLDADVELADGALDALLDAHDHRGGLLSVQPFHRTRRAYEQLSAPFNIVGMMGVGSASPRPAVPPHGAFGPCLVTARADYDVVGGHRAVRADIAEDLALARRYRDADQPVTVLGGHDLVTFRMYPDGLGQLIEGWSKNMATGAGSIPLRRLLLIGGWIACVLMAVQALVGALLGGSTTGALVALVLYAAFVAQWLVMLRQLGTFGWRTAVLLPVPMAAFVLVFARSAYLTFVRRRVAWRGRTVPVTSGTHDGVAAWR